MIVSIVGADGAGKSAIVKMLEEEMKHMNIPLQLLNKWDIFDLQKHPECRLVSASRPLVRQCISEMRGPPRMLFIYWTLYTALSKTEFQPDTLYLLDGYWEKHAAVEVLFGIDEDWILNLVRLLPVPDLTILLHSPAAVRYQRKARTNDFVPYEFGFAKEQNERTFLEHQSRLENMMNAWATRYGWETVDSDRNAQNVLIDVRDRILSEYRSRTSGRRAMAQPHA